MLPKTLDEQLRDGNPVETSDGFPSPRVGKRRQLCNAAQVKKTSYTEYTMYQYVLSLCK